MFKGYAYKQAVCSPIVADCSAMLKKCPDKAAGYPDRLAEGAYELAGRRLPRETDAVIQT